MYHFPLIAYLDLVCDAHVDHGDLVMFADPRLRELLSARWNDRMGEWVHVPENGARTVRERAEVQALAPQLLQEDS